MKFDNFEEADEYLIERISDEKSKEDWLEIYELVSVWPSLIENAFIWGDTPQGYYFWLKEYDSETLSPEADLILRTWAGLIKPRKIKPIEWV